jgi:nucleotide-binding universal stress UspA family protein
VNIKKILVLVDFSPLSVLAVNCGVALARKLNAQLSLLHVVTPWIQHVYGLRSEAEKMEQARQAWAQDLLPTLVAPEDQDDLDVQFLVQIGEFEHVIEALVEKGEADLVVMGTHGRGLFARLLLGSAAQTILRKLRVPVMTVCHAPGPFQFQRILFATDFGFDSRKGFDFALDLADALHSTLIVVHVSDASHVLSLDVPDVSEVVEEGRKQAVEYARRTFHLYEEDGRKRNVPVECLVVEGKAAESLTRIADENDVDLMILGLRRKSLVERTLLGSTAEPLICAAHVPVLSVPIDTPVTVVEDEDEHVGERA